MVTKEKKPLYKRWWFIVVVVVLVLGAFGSMLEDEDVAEEATVEDDETEETIEETADEEITEAETTEPEEPIYTTDEIQAIEAQFSERIDDEREEFGEMFYLHSFEYDEERNTIEAWIDMQFDPIIDDPEEVEEYAEAHAWSLGEAITAVDDPTYDVTLTLVTKVGDDEFMHWGTSRYDRTSNSYSFREGPAMEIIE